MPRSSGENGSGSGRTSVQSIFKSSAQAGLDRSKLRKATRLSKAGAGVAASKSSSNSKRRGPGIAEGTKEGNAGTQSTSSLGAKVHEITGETLGRARSSSKLSEANVDIVGDLGKNRRGSIESRRGSIEMNKELMKQFSFKLNTPKKQVKQEFSWILQRGARELFLSKEGQLSARGVAHRSDAHFKREVARHSRALASANMSSSEFFKCYFCRAFAYARLDQNEQAHADYTETLKLDPKSGASLFNRSQVLVKMGRFEDAIKDLTKAIAVDPTHSIDCYHNRALIYRKMGCFGKAMDDYEERDSFQKRSEQLKAFEEQQKLFQQPESPYGRKSVSAVSPEALDEINRRQIRDRRETQKSQQINVPEHPRSAADFSKISILDGEGRLGSFGRLLKVPTELRTSDHICDITDRLCQLSCLKLVPRSLLEHLALYATYQLTEKDMFVFEEGDYGNSVYVVLSGHVSVRCKPPGATGSTFSESLSELINGVTDKLRCQDIVIAKLFPGMSFGELGDEVMKGESKPAPSEQGDKRDATTTKSAEQNALHQNRDGAANDSTKASGNQESAGESEASTSERSNEAETGEDAQDSVPKQAPQETQQETLETTPPKKKKGRRRRASIRAEEDTEFLHFEVTPKSVNVLREYRQWQVKDRIAAIKKSIIFQKWPEEAVEMLAKMSMELMFAPGAELIKQGEKQVSLFILRQGTCSITKCVDVSNATASDENSNHPLRSREYAHVLYEAENASDYLSKRRQGNGEWKEFEVGMITGGQVAAEFTVLENSKRIASPVTVRAVTTVSTLVASIENITNIMHYFHGESMARVRQSLYLYSTFDAKAIATKYAKNKGWKEIKKCIVLDNVKVSNKLRQVQLDAERETKDQS